MSKTITINTGKVRIKNILAKVEKGDIISDKAFNPYSNGCTRYSLAVWDAIKKHIDITGFTKAEMTYSQSEHYKLTLTHIDGYKIRFNGVSAGYHGEGSRGTYKILTECGFSNSSKCFVNETFIVRKAAYTMSIKPFQVVIRNYKTSGTWKDTYYTKTAQEAIKQANNRYNHRFQVVEAIEA
jgi:hypothetical protein